MSGFGTGSDPVARQGGRMRVSVDLNRCQAYAQCCFLAPEVFHLRGREVLLYDGEPDDAQRERVLRSAAACPVQAIAIEDGAAVAPGPVRER